MQSTDDLTKGSFPPSRQRTFVLVGPTDRVDVISTKYPMGPNKKPKFGSPYYLRIGLPRQFQYMMAKEQIQFLSLSDAVRSNPDTCGLPYVLDAEVGVNVVKMMDKDGFFGGSHYLTEMHRVLMEDMCPEK
jgi:hypothetical protein